MTLQSSIYLFLVSATGIVASLLLPLPLSRRIKFVIGPAVGIIIETQLVLIVSLFFGLNPASIWLSLGVFIAIIGIFLYKLGLTQLSSSWSAAIGSRIRFYPLRRSFSEASRSPPAGGSLQNDVVTTRFANPNVTLNKRRPQLTMKQFNNVNVLRLAVNNWPYVIIGSMVCLTCIFVFWTKVLYPNEWGLTTGGGGLYGDTALHAAYTTSLVYQGMPPQNPLFAGKLLVYPFLVNLFSATLVILGSTLRFSFILPHILYFSAFFTLFYALAKRLVGNLAAFFALLIFFLGWGLGFTVYIQDGLKSGSWAIQREYTNNVPGFEMHNVLTGLIFPERSFLPGLVIGLLITHLMFNQFLNKKPTTDIRQLTTIGFLLGILPLWHTHTFIFFAVAVGVWYTARTPREWVDALSRGGGIRYLWRNGFRHVLITYTIAFLLAAPVFIWFGQQVTHGAFLKFTLGWEPSQKNFLYFWFTNTGILLPLSLIGTWLLGMGDPSRGAPRAARSSLVGWMWGWRGAGTIPRGLFFLPAWIMFIIANLVQFQPWGWDNIKLFSWVFLFLAILAGYTLAKLFLRSFPIRLISLIGLISLIASGALSLILITQQTNGIYSKEDIVMTDWIKSNTKPSDVFLVDPWPNHPVPGLSGRSVYIGYPGHLWVHGIDYGKRESLVRDVLQGNVDRMKDAEVQIDYLVVPNTSQLLFDRYIYLKQVFRNQKFLVYQKLSHP